MRTLQLRLVLSSRESGIGEAGVLVFGRSEWVSFSIDLPNLKDQIKRIRVDCVNTEWTGDELTSWGSCLLHDEVSLHLRVLVVLAVGTQEQETVLGP